MEAILFINQLLSYIKKRISILELREVVYNFAEQQIKLIPLSIVLKKPRISQGGYGTYIYKWQDLSF